VETTIDLATNTNFNKGDLKMKLLKFSLFILLSFVLTSCGKRLDTSSSSPAKAYLLAQQINSAATGNCAISINLEALYHGNVVKRAITSGQASVDTDYFDLVDYNSVTQENIASGDWSTLSYNRKYDAFWKWDETKRKTALKAGASIVNAASVLGAALVIANSLGASTVCAPGSGNANYVATVEAYYNQFSNDEQTEMNAGGSKGFNAASNGTIANFNTLKLALQGGVVVCGTTLSTLSLNSVALGQAYLAGLSRKNGAGLLACARIPRSSCNFGGLTTASLEKAKEFQAQVYEALQNNGDCRKPTDNFMKGNANSFFKGLSSKDKLKAAGIEFSGGMQLDDTGTKLSEGSTSGFSGNILYASSAYPLSSALANINSSFADAFPLKEGTVAYSDDLFSGGSNVNTKTVDSCDTLGLATGPTITSPDSSRRKLTSPAEIAYSLSVQGSAAVTYASIVATPGAVDAVACNRSFRKKFTVPAVLNEKLADLSTSYGDGGATTLASICVYGKDQTTVNTVKGILSYPACPTTAREGASTFANQGLNSINNNFPYKE
jgi:hypothetical protein